MRSDLDAPAIRRSLLRWYRRHRRDLPWRRTQDPYAIWVSEIMLQQTRVETVIPYYEKFLEAFPDPASLAQADEEAVLARWSGLGYYRRARSLHAAARAVVERHEGALPADAAALLALPGFGRYTAGAVASIAFGLREPVVDGNVRRVLSRWLAIDETKLGKSAAERRLWDYATTLADCRSPGDVNQGLMELGATVCTARHPSCDRCPVAEHCSAHRLGRPLDYPAARPRPEVISRDGFLAIIRRGTKLLLERPPSESPLRGSWDLPAAEVATARDTAATAAGLLERRHALQLGRGRLLGSISHGIMNRRWSLKLFEYALRSGQIAERPELRWISEQDFDRVAISGATKKGLALYRRKAKSTSSSGSASGSRATLKA